MEPTERSFGKVAAELRCTSRNIEYFAARWHWVERVGAWDRHQDALNLERFEQMREHAARRRLERELRRQEVAGNVADLLFERARIMLSWPIQEETVIEKIEVTPDGQHLHIHQRVIKPVKWDMNTVVKLVAALDRMQRASVIDATKEQAPSGISDDQIGERSFVLFTPDQIQEPPPPLALPALEQKEDDWTVDYGDVLAQPPEFKVPW